jgi:hypothetical protein
MTTFTNEYGYCPLVTNLEAYWDQPHSALPSDLAQMVQKEFFPLTWDQLDVMARRSIAAQMDYQHDPVHEPAVYFELVQLGEDLKDWEKRARDESKDSVVVALKDVADRIEAILALDRGRVGAEIQELRRLKNDTTHLKSDQPDISFGGHRTKYLVLLAAAYRRWWSRFDPSDNTTAPTNEVVSDWLKSQGTGKVMAEKMATILRIDELPKGPRT